MARGRASAVIAALSLMLAGLSLHVAAAEDVPSLQVTERFVQSIGNRAVEILETCGDQDGQYDEDALKTLIRSGFDIDLIGRFVLGQHLTKVTSEQLEDYHQVYGAFFVTNSAKQLCAFRGDFITVVRSQVIDEKDAVVETRIDRNGETVTAVWRVRTKNGIHKVIDLLIDGVSMALSQREEFAAIIRSGGMASLIDVLRAKTEQVWRPTTVPRKSLVSRSSRALMTASTPQPQSQLSPVAR